MCSCYSDYSFKEKIVGDYYTVEHESAFGKSLFIIRPDGSAIALISGNICEVRSNQEQIFVRKRKDKYSDCEQFFLLDIGTTQYPEDVKQVEKQVYFDFKARSKFKYVFDSQ